MEAVVAQPEIAGTLVAVDPEVEAIIRAENRRQHNKIRLIPSKIMPVKPYSRPAVQS